MDKPRLPYWILGHAPRCLACAQALAAAEDMPLEGGYPIETDRAPHCPDCGALLDLIVIEEATNG